ncbi:MAG: esterase [Bdellovibrionales bacterium]|nr:hypothetical protein [Bdellovibrionales bacterium]NQZ20015.1 esterase [Bdellovibrionales bacterium]
MKWEKFKKLDYISSTQDNSECCVVLFHGYGADANDLASFAKVFNLGQPADWFFPQGVLEVPIGPMMSGRAWFELRVSDFENVSRGDNLNSAMSPQTLGVIQQTQEFLNHLGKFYKKVIFGGFSQGAILSSHCFYRLNFTPSALLLLSGYLVAPEEFPTLAEEQKVPFFQSHGMQDPVLAVSGAQKLYDKLTDMGLKGQWSPFNGGHEIPMNTVADLQKFLQLQL